MEENWPQAHDYLMVSFPLIDRIYAHHEAQKAKVMVSYDLLSSDFGLLTALRRSGEPYRLSPTQIREYMLVSSGGLTKALHRLEKKGLIERFDSAQDKRMKFVQLTAAGIALIEEAVVKVQQNHLKVKESFSNQESEQLDSLLRKLLHVLES